LGSTRACRCGICRTSPATRPQDHPPVDRARHALNRHATYAIAHYLAGARRAGVDTRLDVFPDMLHTLQMAAGRAPEADEAIRRMATWVRPKLGL
jgi:acetyl esterase/lipase